MNSKRGGFDSRYVAWLAILTSLVIIFQVFGSYFKIGATNLSFVLIPIVLGGILLGVKAGAILGFVFSLVVMLMGLFGVDGFTNILLNNAPIVTLILIYSKGILAGVIPALVYKLLSKKNKTLATIISSMLAPIINTALFIICALWMSGVFESNFELEGNSVLYFLVVGCAGINFIVEFAINTVFAPTITRIVDAIRENT